MFSNQQNLHKAITEGAFVETKVDMKSLNKFQQCEYQMPFHSMKLITYESRLKKYVYQPDIIKLSQLKSAFKNDFLWAESLNNQESILFIFLNAYFQVPGDDPNFEFNLQDLFIMGLLLCPSTTEEQSKFLYDLL